MEQNNIKHKTQNIKSNKTKIAEQLWRYNAKPKRPKNNKVMNKENGAEIKLKLIGKTQTGIT